MLTLSTYLHIHCCNQHNINYIIIQNIIYLFVALCQQIFATECDSLYI